MEEKKFIGGLRWDEKFSNGFGNSYMNGNATFPFATLKICNDKCVLTRHIFWIKYVSYVIPYEDIEYVSVKQILFSKGIVFTHTNKNIPKFLLFWTDNFWEMKKTNKILAILKQKGIRVA